MFEGIDSTRVGSSSLYDSIMDIEDLAFLDLIMCIDDADRALCAKMRELRALNAEKQGLIDDIAKLQDAIRDSGAKKDDDTVNVPGGMPDSVTGRNRTPSADAGADHPALSDSSDVHTMSEPVLRKDVEDAIETLRSKLEDLNTNSSVMLIDLQRLQNQRNEVVQLTSNIISKSHQTAMSVIANIK